MDGKSCLVNVRMAFQKLWAYVCNWKHINYFGPMELGMVERKRLQPLMCRKVSLAKDGESIGLGLDVANKIFLYIDECIEATRD